MMDEILKKISLICRSIAKGNYDFISQLEELTIEGRYPDLVTELAESFSLMLLKLQIHEHKLEKAIEALKEKNSSLKEKVHTLKIDIDKLKKAKAVAEISKSSFFKEIQKKARAKRKK